MFRKRLFIISLLFILAFVSLAAAGSAAAQDRSCIAFSVELRNDYGSPLTADVYFAAVSDDRILSPVASLTLHPGETGVLRLVWNVLNGIPFYLGGGPGGLTILSASSFGDAISSDNCDGGFIGDGRINDGPNQLAAPVAVYCAAGNIDVYKIDATTGAGSLVIREPQVSGKPAGGANTLLASEQGVSLSWLADGRYQIDTVNFEGNPFIIIWNGCDRSSVALIAPQP